MTDIGYAVLKIIPSLDGVSAAVQRQLGFLPGMGRSAGQSLGDGLAAGVDAAARKVETATGKITAANKKVEDQTGKLRVAEAQLQALRDRGVTDAGRLAAAEERVAAAQRNLQAASNGATRATNELERAQEELTRAQQRANDEQDEGARSSGRFSGALGRMGEQAGGAVGNLKNLAVAAAGIGSAMELATTAMDFESATAKMNASLGATGALAEEYGKTAASLYGKGFGDSMDDVATAVEAVASTMLVLGAEDEVSLDKATERAMNLAKAFGLDVAEGVQTAEQMITNGLAKNSTEAMDLLAAAMQRMPTALRGELPEILNEYGKHFQTFGMSGQAAMALIVDMAPQGQIALDKTGDAIKELSIRATDGSKATTEAFAAIKVDGDKMAEAIAKGGPGAQAAMQEIAKGLLSIEDPATRAQQSIALFGTPLEDLGVDKIPAFLSALSGTSGSMSDFEGTVDEVGEALNDTAQGKLTAFGRSVQTHIIDALGGTIGFFQENKQLITDLGIAAGVTGGALLIMAGPAVMTAIKTAVTSTKLWTAGQWLLNAAMTANPIGLVVAAVAALVAGIVIAYRNSETFRNIVAGAWNWIKDAASNVVSWFTDTAWPFLQRAWDGIQAGIGALVDGAKTAWDNFTAPARAVVDWFTGTLVPWLDETWENVKLGFRVIVAVAQEVWDGVKEKFTGLVDFVGSLPGKIRDKVSGMFDGMKDAFKSAINWIIEKWNSFRIEAKIPDSIPIIGGKGFTLDTPDIPLFAGGGWTGPGSKYQAAGIVHADEFVLSKAARGALESAAPGGLDFMNKTGRWPGYADGGRVAYGLPVGTAISYGQSDKFPEWVRVLEQRFGVKASTYAGHQERDGQNKGIDWSGSVDAMQKFAEYLATIPGQLEQVIWQNPSTGQTIGVADGKPVGPGTDQPGYYRNDWSGHRDHVHTRQSFSFGTVAAAAADPVGVPIADAVTSSTAGYAGLTGDALKTQYDADLAALKKKYGIGASNTELADRAQDIAKRKRDLAAKYRSDKESAKGDKDRLKQLADEYTTASNALKTESDRLADDRDAAGDTKVTNKAEYEREKEALDAKYKQAKDGKESKSESKSDSGSKGYPTSISGWAGFIGEHFVGGQIKSLLSVFGIPDSPAWMQGVSQLIGGIKVSDKDGKSLFDGSNPFGGIAAAVDGKKPETKATAEAAGPGAALPITDAKATPDTKAVETLTSALSAPKADYKGGTPEIHDAVYKAFRDAGYDNAQWGDLVTLINRESAWNPEARNPSSDAYGLGQFLTQGNIDKYLGGQNRDVPVDKQGAAIMQYIKDRYGDPSKALAFHDANNWYADGGLVKPYLYDAGGLLPQGVSLVENRSGGPEPILTQDYWSTAKTAIDVATSMFQGQAGGQQKQLPQVNYTINTRDTEDAFIRAQRQEKERAAAKLSRF